ncbi:hypothetical protein M0R01_02420 [bacterium]|nr:hypothetical protein [bacterium]
MAQIELNKEQYLKVLQAIGIAGMMEEFITEEDSEEAVANKNYEFEEYLLGFAKEYGLEDDEEWFDELMADAYDMANEYGETDMYQRLAWELAILSFKEKYGKDFNNDSDEDFEKAMELEDQFLDEFEESGLDNVKIVK